MVPRTFTRRAVTALALLLCACAPLHAAPAAAALPPIERFFTNPVLADAKLSPNARYLAAIYGMPGRRAAAGRHRRAGKKPRSWWPAISDGDIRHFDWVNDDRLVFDITDRQVAPGGSANWLPACMRSIATAATCASWRSAAAPPVVTTGSRINRKMLPWHTFMLDHRAPRIPSSSMSTAPNSRTVARCAPSTCCG